MFEPDPEPEVEVRYSCDDCFFDQFGDMLTINELRRLRDLSPDRRQLADQFIAEYELAGIDADQDPSLVTIQLRAVPDETDEQFTERALEAIQDAWQVRKATPDDFA